MQKRTNPLALKGDAVAENEVRRDRPVAPAVPKVASQKDTAAPVASTKTVVSAPDAPRSFGEVSRIQKASEMTAPRTATLKPSIPQPQMQEVAEPDLTDDWMESVVLDEQEEQDDVLMEEQQVAHNAPASFVPTAKRDDVPPPSDVIVDEEPFPTLEDFELASRFSLRGSVSRRIVLGKVSRDVCRLAQLLHPEQKLSTIIENALMTRIFLENPEAFDAMAAVIEEKGGRIKC